MTPLAAMPRLFVTPSRRCSHRILAGGALAGGLFGIALCESLLAADLRGWTAGGPLQGWGRFLRVNMTPLVWCCYLLALLGLLGLLARRPFLRPLRNRLAVCWLWSVACWCYFDWMNFYFMRDPATGLRAWEYIGLPPAFSDRIVGYLIAFGAICPGMFLSAELFSRLGVGRLAAPPLPLPTIVLPIVAVVGLLLCAVPLLVGGPISNLALWLGTFCVLDPLNLFLGRPSILADWRRGYWGRTLSLGLGGLWCGLLWEFWNYWALARWVYHLPFLGRWEHLRYFEMPLPGLAGFIAFGIQTWVMWQTTLWFLRPFVEGERAATSADHALAARGCL